MKRSVNSIAALLLACTLSLSLVGCGGTPVLSPGASSGYSVIAPSPEDSSTSTQTGADTSGDTSAAAKSEATSAPDASAADKSAADKSAADKSAADKSTAEKEEPSSPDQSAPAKSEEDTSTDEPTPPAVDPDTPDTDTDPEDDMDSSKFCVLIDPGHQGKGNYDKEPVGPGSSQMKTKVSSGTQGRFSGVPEYIVTLQVSLLLKDELERRGFRVVMTRTSHDVNISNSQRARMADDVNADIIVRIHANGSEDPSVHGGMTICMTKNNPYCADLYPESRQLSACILEKMSAATGCAKRKIWETDTMTGINWANVPVTIVEMGYMTNQKEDMLLVDSGYQKKMARGIADGIEEYFQLPPA